MLIVKKFDGTTLKDKEAICYTAEHCAEEYRKGNEVVVVVSAMGDQTEELLAQAKILNPEPSQRELAQLMAIGEQMSAALLAMAIEGLEVPAVSLNAFQMDLQTAGASEAAEVKSIDVTRIKEELEQKKIVIVTGGQGIGENKDCTRLAGGAEETALLLAEVLEADACECYTETEAANVA